MKRVRGALFDLARLGVLALALLDPGSAAGNAISVTYGDSGAVIRWPTPDLTYYLHPACSEDLEPAVCKAELDASFTEWTGQACSDVAFTKLGESDNLSVMAAGYAPNGLNELAFIEGSDWAHGSRVLGVAVPLFFFDGTIVEADIAFNGLDHTWETSGDQGTIDVKNVAVHEIGHFMGLQHVLEAFDPFDPADPPTMAPTADPDMKSRTPEADDLDGVCFLYPAASSPYTCDVDDDCPWVLAKDPTDTEYYVGRMTCLQGTCGGTALEGQQCDVDIDCATELCVEDPSGRLCRRLCTTDDECDGDSCIPLDPPPGGYCTGAGPDGSPCAGPQDCQSSLCASDGVGPFLCTQRCTDSSECPPDWSCKLIGGGPESGCFDIPEGLELGEPCSAGNECKSGLCAGFQPDLRCTQPCLEPDDCPEGFVCNEDVDGCFEVGDAEIGQPCDTPFDCRTLQCISTGGPFFCTDSCVEDAECGCGFQCFQFAEGRLCIPGPPSACLPNGSVCTDPAECNGGYCIAGLWESGCRSWPPGGCTLCDGWEGSADPDMDGIPEKCDLCPDLASADQGDQDGDGFGDPCDVCPGFDDAADADDDGVPDGCETCFTDPGVIVCDDENPCTEDTCEPDGCVFTELTGACDDGNACTEADECVSGACVGTALDCDDDNFCTDDSCADGLCINAPNAFVCDDADPCTLGDACRDGQCTGTPMTCDDGQECVDGDCVETGPTPEDVGPDADQAPDAGGTDSPDTDTAVAGEGTDGSSSSGCSATGSGSGASAAWWPSLLLLWWLGRRRRDMA